MKAISDARLKKLKESGRFNGTTFAASKPSRKKAPASTSPDRDTVERVWERDKGRCVPCGERLFWAARGYQWSVSHRKLRSQGGGNRLSNLMLSCGNGTQGCEGSIHAHPERARDAGWMVGREFDPAVIPVEHSQYGHVLLLDDGGWSRVEAEFIPREESDERHPF